MVLRMAERGEKFECLFTPTGNELPGVVEHVERVAIHVKRELHRISDGTLEQVIEENQMLPNHRARFCTRIIKIEACMSFLQDRPGSILCVGLRADEDERQGLYGAHVVYRRPLKEWGWGFKEVVDYCKRQGIEIPRRTDCAWCFYQRLSEWRDLWRDHPDMFKRGIEIEERYGHTFRSSTRDGWPASIRGLGEEFAKGRVPQTRKKDRVRSLGACRVCSF